MTELMYLGVLELGARIANQELSPVELSRACLARHDECASALNAFISISPSEILDQARNAESQIASSGWKGPLHGVPVAIKDNIHVRGQVSTAGSRALAGFMPFKDAAVIKRLREAGAIIFGKTNLPELAYGPADTYSYGPTHNPWDVERFAGGSSMGSGAAISAGVVPVALGTDTSGSIRNPASWCGIVGLSTTAGRVSTLGTTPLARSLDRVGPMARSAEDCFALLQIIEEWGVRKRVSSANSDRPGLATLEPLPVGTRIGIFEGQILRTLPPSIQSAVEAAAGIFESQGFDIRPVEIPRWEAMVEVSDIIIRCEAAAEHRQLVKDHGTKLVSQVKARLEAGLGLSAVEYLDAMRERVQFQNDIAALFECIDLLILPSRDRTAPAMDPFGRLLEPLTGLQFTSPVNIAGVPAVSIPCGQDDLGLPIGLQIVGRAWEEELVLSAAHTYQQHTDWHLMRPQASWR